MVTRSCREAMAYSLASQTDFAGKVALRFREQSLERRSYPADFPVDFEGAQASGDKAREPGDNVGGSEINTATHDHDLHLAKQDRSQRVGGRKAAIEDGGEVRDRANTESAFSIL